MVEFGKRLKDECAQHGADWQRHCIDYGALKDLIDLEKRAQGGQPDVGVGDSALAVATDVAHAPCFQFRQALDRQVEMAVLFVLEEQGRIASALVVNGEDIDVDYVGKCGVGTSTYGGDGLGV